MSDFALGDPVIGLSDWLATKVGTQAEFVVLDAAALAPPPSGVSAVEASTLPANAPHTAAQALDLLALAEGQILAVTGAGGAVGGYAVELARHRGIRVIGIGSDQDEAFITRLGATFVARSEDPAGAIRALAPGGVDAVLDAAVVGGAVIGAVRDGGAFVGLVPPAAPPAERRIRVSSVGLRSDGAQLRELVGLVEQGRPALRVARTFALEQAAEAHEALARGGVRGRLVLVP